MESEKNGKEDEKSMRPMFPRLHVNDADKGGPRAPPRNKMSLYEQLSIPSQKFSSPTLTPRKPGSVLPSASSLQEHNHEGVAFSSFYLHHSTPTHSAEKPCPQSSDVESFKNRGMELDSCTDRIECTSSRAAISGAEGSTFNVRDASGENSFKAKHEDDDDDFRVPTLVHPKVMSHSKDTGEVEVKRPSPFGTNNAQKSPTLDSSREPIHEANVSGKLSQHEKIHGEEESGEALSSKENVVEFSNLPVDEILADPSKNSVVPSDREFETKMRFFDKIGYQSARISKESAHNVSIVGLKSSNDTQFHENINTSNMINESSSGASSGYSQGSYDDKENGSGELKDTARTGEVSDVSMIDSFSGMEFSPDDVVGVIGPKQFWKARREIVNQQRVFAIQVFELHRLIKVQKLFAASPRLLVDDSHFMTTQPKVSSKSLPIASSLNYPSSEKPVPLVEKPAGPTPQTQERNPNTRFDQFPRSIPLSINPPPIPLPLDNRTNPWCFHQTPNQWLVPVMSPSEGLIYKPYAGLCPPSSGFMAPYYGNLEPPNVSMPSVTGNFMNTPCGIPSSHQQQNCSPALDTHYFGIPSINPVIASSGVGQVSPLTSARPDVHSMLVSQSSCNMSITKSIPLPAYPPRNNAFLDTELHASTASSRCDRAPGAGSDMLPLFPIAPVTERSGQPSQSCDKEHQTQVIKVVPHNARSATESAARIFRTIQEERQQPYS